MNNLDVTDPTFVSDLKASNNAVWVVARWLQQGGEHVVVRAQYVRDSCENRMAYSDQGDIEVLAKFEVKHRQIEFTDAADYPYPTVIVDVMHSWDNAQPKPYYYIITNKAMTHAAIVDCRTSHLWSKERLKDTHAGRERDFYMCPKEHCEWAKLT